MKPAIRVLFLSFAAFATAIVVTSSMLDGSMAEAGKRATVSKKSAAKRFKSSAYGQSWPRGREAEQLEQFDNGAGESFTIRAKARLDQGTIDVYHDVTPTYAAAKTAHRGQWVHPVASLIKAAVEHYTAIVPSYSGAAPRRPQVRVAMLASASVRATLLGYRELKADRALPVESLRDADMARIQRDPVYKALILEGFKPEHIAIVRHQGALAFRAQ